MGHNPLNQLSECAVDWRTDWLDFLPELDCSLRPLDNTFWCEFEFL
jgi:hypothetical protein